MSDEPKAAPDAEPGEVSGGFRFRDTTRAPFTTDVRLRFDRLGGAVSAETADISMEGMFVKTAEPRPVGTLVQFEFDFDDGETVQGLGDVVWVRARGSENKPAGMGIQFRYVDPKSREHVFKIVSNFISEISGSEAMPSIPTDGPPDETPVVPTGTVAVPLASLPGLGEQDAFSHAPDLAPPSESARELGLTPPPPPPSPSEDDDGPFGGLLRGEAGEAGGEGEERGEAPRSSLSGSFSLSVPRQDTGASASEDGPSPGEDPSEASPSRLPAEPPGMDGPDQGVTPELGDPLAATVDHRAPDVSAGAVTDTPESPADVLAGGVASDPALGSPSIFESSGSVADRAETAIDEPSLFGPSATERTPVEPYVPPSENADPYRSGAARSDGGSRRGWLLGVLLVTATAAALFIYRPWEQLLSRAPSAGTGDPAQQSVPAGGEPAPAASADVGLPGEGDPPEESDAQSLGSADDAGDTSSVGSDQSRGDASSSTPTIASEASPPAAAPSPDRNWPRDGRLAGVEAISGAGQTVVRITADRPLTATDFETVSLSSPPRYLVKIRGLDALYTGGIEGLMFRGLRSGVHLVDGRSELHLVFDMTSAGFEAEAQIADGELLVTFR